MEIETVAAQFLFWEYLFKISGIVFLQCGAPSCHGQLSGFESGHPSKIINGQHKAKELPIHSGPPPKNIIFSVLVAMHCSSFYEYTYTIFIRIQCLFEEILCVNCILYRLKHILNNETVTAVLMEEMTEMVDS